MASSKRSKNQIRRERSKLRKLESLLNQAAKDGLNPQDSEKISSSHRNEDEPDSQDIENSIATDETLLSEYEHVFRKFNANENDAITISKALTRKEEEIEHEVEGTYEDESDEVDESINKSKETSKRRERLRNKVPLATLKASTSVPQVVEWYDSDSRDPFFLVYLKSQPNVVHVPSHWLSKRDYLSSRRGIERPPFELPAFIKDTGIQDMRNVESRTLRQQQREKVQPKMGQLDIDYQKLHNAFYLHQTKPRMLAFGDLYFEGKELTDPLEQEIEKYKPGVVSKELRNALGLPGDDYSIPPPWLNIMIEMGKPPAYEELIIPGIDEEYTNSGYKEPHASSRTSTEYVASGDLWGALIEVESSEEEDDDDDDDDEIESEGENDNDENMPEFLNASTTQENESNSVPITEYGTNYRSTAVDVSSSEHRSLYTVVAEEKDEEDNGLIKNELKYDLKRPKDASSNEKSEVNPTKRDESKSKKTFKF